MYAKTIQQEDATILSESEDDDIQIVITVNGPGEISGWLYPLGTMLRRRLPNARICVSIVPCTFSTGAERSVVAAMPFVDAISDVRETMSMLIGNRTAAGFRRGGPGFMLHLGGEKALSLLLAQRLALPALAYVEQSSYIDRLFRKVYYSGFVKQSDAVGELMVDAALMRCPNRPLRSAEYTIGLYPGSRASIVKYILPFYARVATEVCRRRPNTRWVLAKADYLSTDFLKSLEIIDDARPLDWETLRWDEMGDTPALVTPSGIRIPVQSSARVGATVDLALTTPGSNTAEMAALGIPMVVTLPTYWAESSALPGLGGHIGRIPLIGRWVKRGAAHLYLRNLRYTSHPNRRADRLVVPEIVGRIGAKEVADAIVATMDSDTGPIEDDLRAVMGPPGAADRLVDRLLAFQQEERR